MLKKRIVGVITVKNGWAVQSFGYSRHLPLGRPEVLAENLDRWGVDEIVVQCIDRSHLGLGPDFGVIQRIGSLGLSTPLVYGGGIATVDHARGVIEFGADRICLDSSLWTDHSVIRAASALLGAQALIGVLPLGVAHGELHWKNYLNGITQRISDCDLSLFKDRVVSEALIVDWAHEGFPQGFDLNLVTKFPLQDVPLITFGGLSHANQLRELLSSSQVVAVAVGNFLSYREHALQHYREQLIDQPIRPAYFEDVL